MAGAKAHAPPALNVTTPNEPAPSFLESASSTVAARNRSRPGVQPPHATNATRCPLPARPPNIKGTPTNPRPPLAGLAPSANPIISIESECCRGQRIQSCGVAALAVIAQTAVDT